MKCRDVRKQITAYLDEEVSPSEKKLIQAHLADCQDCQRELEALGVIRENMRQHLRARAATVAASPQAWSLLQDSLPAKDQNQAVLKRMVSAFSIRKWSPAGRMTVQRIAIALLILTALVVFVPPVRAQVETWISTWFSFTNPDGKSGGAIGGFTAFNPYHATYLPEGFQQSLLGGTTSMMPEIESLELGYSFDEQFIILVQSKGSGVTGLPMGENVHVDTNPAVFIPSYATSQQDLVEKRPTISTDTSFAYENTNLLTWFIGEIKIEMFSSLSKAEMLRVAESLEPMRAAEGETPAPIR